MIIRYGDLHKRIQSEIIQAIEQLMNRRFEKAGFDITRVGTVIEVLGNNKYSVMINGSAHTVPCAVDLNLSIGNSVYVTAPQNNFDSLYISGIKRK